MKQGDLFGDDARRSEAPEPPARPEPPRERPPAPRERGEPVADDAARRLAVTEFAQPILLAAGAGTGKTATLVARVVQWCLGPGWDDASAQSDGRAPEETAVAVLRSVSAITFTEAAAAEMSTRVGQALARVQRVAAARAEGTPVDEPYPIGLVLDELPPDPDVLRERARALRAALDHLNASTIHAFCRRMLAAHPLAVGLDPAFVVDASFTRTEVCVRDVIEEYLREAWAEPVEPDLLALARFDVAPPEIEAAVIALMDGGARAADLEGVLLDEAGAEALGAKLEAAVADLTDVFPAFAGARGNASLAVEALAETAVVLAAADGTALERFHGLSASLREVWTGDARRFDRIKDWGKDKLTDGEKKLRPLPPDEFRTRVARLRAALEPFLELDLEKLEPARRVVARVMGAVEAELRRRGVATFNDLLSETARLFREHPEIAARERRRLRLLLVDEFQDTDAQQCEIVAALGLGGPREERPSLFLVGDPKQSIFAWRNADLAAFDDFAERVLAAGGRRLELTANFRSRAAVLDEVARAVAPVMEEERGVQPPFAALEPGRADARTAAGGPAVEYWASWPRDASGAIRTDMGKRQGASYAAEAAALASDIRARHDAESGEWRDFALVFRSFTDLEPYLQELREAGIPYEVQSDRKYYQRREVIDATALVRAAIDPFDHLALLTLVRSPMVGVPDVALLPLFEAGLPAAVARLHGPDEERLAALAELVRGAAARVPADAVPGLSEIAGWEESLIAALGALALARKAFRDEPADRWIDTLRWLFLPDVVESARFLGAYRLANLERFFRDLLAAVEEREGDVLSIVRTLRANLAREDRTEATRPGDSGQDAVRVLTIHGAKGLEFRHVYLVQTHKTGAGRGGPRNAFDRRAGFPAFVLFGAKSPGWFETERVRAEAEAAERVRLLYVALTRAAERLVVLGGFALAPARKPWWRAGTLAELLEHRPGAAAAAKALAARATEGDAEPFVDEHGTTWRLAAAFERPEPAAAGSEAEAVASLAAVERESRELAAAREAAALRSRRPFSSTASSEAHADGAELRASRRFREPATEGDGGGAPDAGDAGALDPIGRDAAQAAGTAVHRALEGFDLAAERGAELERWKAAVEPLARSLAPEDRAQEAVSRARALLDRVAENGLLERLAGLELVARELPVLLPVDEDVAAGDPSAPVGFVSGAIDLLYRDPATGRLVVADYKTDVVETEAEVKERTALYRPQGAAYVEAVQEALALDEPPRFELWFLAAGRVETA